MAIATLLAVIVALSKEEIVKIWHRPKLVATIKLAPPDSHKASIVLYGSTLEPLSLKPLKQADCYYFRLWVQNNGRARAEKVQVFAKALSKRIADGTFRPVNDFLPMNFQWSHTHEKFADGISPKMGKHCDIGHIIFPGSLVDFQEDHSDAHSGSTILALDLEAKPLTKNHLVLPGTYRLTLNIAAANSSPITKVIELTLTGDWFDDQRRMFSDGVGIKILD
jgi:hypothetical protein